MTAEQQVALGINLEALVVDVGRFYRRTEAGSSLRHLADRIAGSVENLVLLFEPTAAEIAGCSAPGSDEAATEAVRIVDERWRRLQERLGRAA